MSTGKKIALILVAILIVLAAYLLIKISTGKKEPQAYVLPKLELAGMHILNLNMESAEMEMSMVIENPLPVGIKIDSIQYVAFIEDKEIARMTYPDSLKIGGAGHSEVSLPMTIYYKKLIALFERLEREGRDTVELRVNTRLFAPLFFKKDVDIKITRNVPLITIPEISIEDIKVRNLTLKGCTLYITAIIDNNNNVIPFNFTDMTYELGIEEHDAVKGSIGTMRIPAHDTAVVTIPVDLRFKNIKKSIPEVLFQGGKTHYDLKLDARLDTENYTTDKSRILLTSSGPLKELTNAVKK